VPAPHCLPSALAVGTTSQPGALSPRGAMDAGPALFLPRGARSSRGGLPRRIARGSPRSRPGGRSCRPLLIDVDARLGLVRPPEQISGRRTGHSFQCRTTAARARCADGGGQAPGSGNHSCSAAPVSAHVALSHGGARDPRISGGARRLQTQTPGAEARFAHRDHASAPGDVPLSRHYGRRCARQLDSSSAS